MALIGSLFINVKGNTKDFNRSMKKSSRITLDFADRTKFATKAAIGFGAAVSGIVLGVGAAAILKIGKAATKVAIDFVEAQQKFDVVFGAISDQALNTRNSLAKNFGLSKKAATELLSGTGDLLTGFGMTDAAALEMSNSVQELAVDLASFSNIEGGATRASEILTKALLGERDSLVSLGVKISEADVKQRLLENGQKNLTGEALLAARATATYELILSQTAKAQGDFSRSSDSLANKQRILNARFEDAQAILGRELLPIQVAMTNQLIKLSEKTSLWLSTNKGVINSGIMKFVEGLSVGLAIMADTLELGVAAWSFFAAGAKTALAGLLLPLAGVEFAVNKLLEALGTPLPKDPPIKKLLNGLIDSAQDSAQEFTDAMERFNNATKSSAVKKFFADIISDSDKAATSLGLFAGAGEAASGTGRRRDFLKRKSGRTEKAAEFITVDLRNISLKAPQKSGKTVEEKQLEENKKTNEFLKALAAHGVQGRGTASARAE